MSNVDNDVLCAVGIRAADAHRDADFVVNPILNRLAEVHGKGKPTKKGGQYWSKNLMSGKHSEPTRHRTGFEQVTLDFASVSQPSIQKPAEVCYPIGISYLEEDVEADADSSLDIAASRTKKVINQAKRDFEKNALQTGVAMWEDFSVLNGTDDTAAGIIEENATGSQGSSIGGYSKSTFAAVEGASNQIFDVAASANTKLFQGVIDIGVKCRNRAEDPTAYLSMFSEKAFVSWKRIVGANERYTPADGKPIDATVMVLQVNGVPATSSTYMPNAGTNTTADPWSYLYLDLLAIYFTWSKAVRDGYFGMGDFEPIGGDYNARVAKVLVRGNWQVELFSTSGLAFDGDTF